VPRRSNHCQPEFRLVEAWLCVEGGKIAAKRPPGLITLNPMKNLIIGTLLLITAGTASAQNRTTELQARSYIESAFITGVAQSILANDVALGAELREKLSLPANAGRDRTYQALFTLTEDRPIRVRKASAEEASALAGRALARPVFALEGGAVPLLVVYDLDRNAIPYVSVPGGAATASTTRR
jgi:hypothetical protein